MKLTKMWCLPTPLSWPKIYLMNIGYVLYIASGCSVVCSDTGISITYTLLL